MKTVWSAKRIFQEARRITGAPNESEQVRCAAVLLAAAFIGTRTSRIAERLELPEKDIRYLVDRLRSQGVFWRGKVRHSGWFGKGGGGAAFCLDVAVGCGLLDRVKA